MSRADNGGKVTHVRWSKEMEVLIDTLVEQIGMGNKGDNGWKSVAYHQVRANIKSKLDIEVSTDNVKNRLKTWKESYAAMSFLLKKSGFGRHPTNRLSLEGFP
ncbi:hypothetical protein MKX01_033958 [Papaver californicum]|nr:hypothetical protein MKX01_033958 [Papaver californicum]